MTPSPSIELAGSGQPGHADHVERYAPQAGHLQNLRRRQTTLSFITTDTRHASTVKEARKEDFDSIIRIRSYHNEQFAPNATDIECDLGKKTASVTLRAFMANRK